MDDQTTGTGSTLGSSPATPDTNLPVSGISPVQSKSPVAQGVYNPGSLEQSLNPSVWAINNSLDEMQQTKPPGTSIVEHAQNMQNEQQYSDTAKQALWSHAGLDPSQFDENAFNKTASGTMYIKPEYLQQKQAQPQANVGNSDQPQQQANTTSTNSLESQLNPISQVQSQVQSTEQQQAQPTSAPFQPGVTPTTETPSTPVPTSTSGVPQANAAQYDEQKVQQFIQQGKTNGYSDDEIRDAVQKAASDGAFNTQAPATPTTPQTQDNTQGLNTFAKMGLDFANQYAKPIETLGNELSKPIDALIDKAMGRQFDPADKFTTADVSKIGNAAMGATFNAVAPLVSAAINTVASTPGVHYATDALGTVIQKGGELVNNIPGLSNFKDTLTTPEDKQAFDSFVGSLLTLGIGKGIGKAKGMDTQATIDAYNNLPQKVAQMASDKLTATPEQKLGNINEDLQQTNRQVLQPSKTATPSQISSASSGIGKIDTTGIKTYQDLVNTLKESSQADTKLMDSSLKNLDIKITPENDKITVGSTSTSPVANAISDLKELYTKTNDIAKLDDIKNTEAKYNSDTGLSAKETNDLARQYGKDESAFSDKTGNQLTSSSAEYRENTRSGIKDLLKQNTPADQQSLWEHDKDYSDKANALKMVQDFQSGIDQLKQKQPGGFGPIVSKIAGTLFDIGTAGIGPTVLRGILSKAGMNFSDSMSKMDIEKALNGNLTRLKKLNVGKQSIQDSLNNNPDK